MFSHTLVNRMLILGFMVLVGYFIARSIQAGNTIGLVLAIVSLGAGLYFLYLLAKAKAELEQQESNR